MKTDEKIARIREMMADKGIDAVIVPSDDPHKSEYVAEHWQARKWLTGFSGSAGTAVVTRDMAILWTDFRYYIQAEKQIQNSEFQLFKMGKKDVPTVQKWLVDTLKPGSTVGIDGNMFSISYGKKLNKQFEPTQLLLNSQIDFISEIWADRPPMPDSKAFEFDTKYTGESRADKIGRIKKEMEKAKADYHLMVSLDDIAWTLNLRGSDVHTNPVNIAFLLIGMETSRLFINPAKLDPEVLQALNKNKVEVSDYSDVMPALSEIEDGQTILIDPENTSVRLREAIADACRVVEKRSPAVALKVVKNKVQIGHMEDTAVKDGVVMVRFLHWLEHQRASDDLTELSVADKLYGLRQEQDGFVDNSFDPIMAFQDHSAMCHYSATQESGIPIGDAGIFLTDSGGNYLTGTTDITRTIARSKPTDQQIRDYTLVLKGHIAVATVVFPQGTRGVQIDTLARQYMWQQGLDFGHGTGHGVGFFLCVHEGPARISPHPADEAIKKGMLLTNEPGIYREGEYGMRLENMILVEDECKTDFGTFLKFRPMTYCHFERNLIDPDGLTADEKAWLNAYHQMVYEQISPHLEEAVALWLESKTKPL